MSLLKTIKSDQIAARKAKDTDRIKLLTTLYSEAANVGLNDGKRESTDAEVTATIKKFIKNINETIDAANCGNAVMALNTEKEILENYLPTQLTESQLTTIVNEIKDQIDNPNMGQIMGQLKANYNGQFDGKLASTVVRAALQ